MAPAFYNRYVPPSAAASAAIVKPSLEPEYSLKAKRKRHDQEVPGPEDKIKKRKKSKPGKDGIQKPADGSDGVNPKSADLEVDGEPSKAATGGTEDLPAKGKKRKKRRHEEQPNVDQSLESKDGSNSQDAADLDQTKHQGVWSKFKRSKAIAESKQIHDEDVRDRGAAEEPIETHGLVPLPQPAQVDEDAGPVVSALPDWLSKPVRVSSSATAGFTSLNLSEATTKALQTAGYQDALPVQAAVLPMLLPGPGHSWGDLCISAATGSGKTLAYALPLIEDLKKTANTRLRAVIVVPTRELVVQVQSTFLQCDPGGRLRVGTGTGNKSLRDEQKALIEKTVRYDSAAYERRRQRSEDDFAEHLLEDVLDMADEDAQLAFTEGFVVEHESKVDVLVCTPGRLVEHIRSTRGFTLEHTRWLVIDEADSLLDQSFQEWTECVIPAVHAEPKLDPLVQQLRARALMVQPKRVRKIILSATMTKDVGKLAPLRLRGPKLLVVESTERIQHAKSEARCEPEIPDEEPVKLELPALLQEVAISVKRAGEKPLYVLELWKDLDSPDVSSKRATNSAAGFEQGTETGQASDDGFEPDVASSADSKSPEATCASPAPTSSSTTRGMLVFTNSNESALRLARLLAILRPDAAARIRALTKSSGTASGRKALRAFTNGRVSVLVASDRASRGLDLPELAHVVSYDMPAGLTSYVHRVGRTARANKAGRATTLVAHAEARWFWNEVARTDKVHRAAKVARDDWFFRRITKAMSVEYEAALAQLGEEAGAA